MKLYNTIRTWMAIILILFMVQSCSKAGVTGPAGPAGATGPAGPTGPQGNANVQTFIFLKQSFSAGLVNTFSIPAITQNVLDSGAVIIYTRLSAASSGDTWIQLPWIINPGTGIYDWNTYVGNASYFGNFNSSSISTFDFKVVVIPGP
jgi:hypothetical protein